MKTGFPLEVLPQAVQSLILDMATYENYKIEFYRNGHVVGCIRGLGRRIPYPHQRRFGRAAERCTSFW